MITKTFFFSYEIIRVELNGPFILINYLTNGHDEGIRSDVSCERIQFASAEEAHAQCCKIILGLVSSCGAITIKEQGGHMALDVLKGDEPCGLFTIIDNIIINNRRLLSTDIFGQSLVFTSLEASSNPYIRAQVCKIEVPFPDEDGAKDALEFIAEADVNGSAGIIISKDKEGISVLQIIRDGQRIGR